MALNTYLLDGMNCIPLKKNQMFFVLYVLAVQLQKICLLMIISDLIGPNYFEIDLTSYYPNKKIEVINLGYSAYSTPHFLVLLFLDVVSWKPDVIIISENINDLLAAYWPDISYDYSNKYCNEFYNPLAKLIKEETSFVDLLFQYFNIYWIAKDRINRIQMKYATDIRRKSYGDSPPELAKEIFARNLENFVVICQKYGIKVIMGTQPIQPSAEYCDLFLKSKPYNGIIIYPFHNEFVKHLQYYNKCIKNVAEEKNVYLIDNDNILNGDKMYFIDLVHYSKEGSNKMAFNYFEYIINKNLINK